MERELRDKKPACSTILLKLGANGLQHIFEKYSVVKSASLAKGGISKKTPSPHLHESPSRRIKASPRTFQTALVYFSSKLIIPNRFSFEVTQSLLRSINQDIGNMLLTNFSVLMWLYI
jgi:hypothetical protein